MTDSLGLLLLGALCALAYVAIGREHDDRCECHGCRQRRGDDSRRKA